MIQKFWCLDCGLELCRYDSLKNKFDVFYNPVNFKDNKTKRLEKSKKHKNKNIIQSLPVEIVSKLYPQITIKLKEKDWNENQKVFESEDKQEILAEFVKNSENEKAVKINLQKVLSLWVHNGNAICLNDECGTWYNLRILKDKNASI
ncbi:MAG: hypothetical protein PHQ18_01230 [Patescibacteria group bacterium]|nr:hypothetical protein [Patescibacteria group bacterium]